MVSISEKVHGDFLTKSQYKNYYEEVCSFEMYLTFIKFIYSEKAKKICKISALLLSYVVPVKSKMDISQNFVAFSEYMNFKLLCILIQKIY